MRDTYEDVVHWRRNSFLVPSGKSGKEFVLELARLYPAYANNSSLHSIALTAYSVFQVLLLQKPHANSKSKEHILYSKKLWRGKNFGKFGKSQQFANFFDNFPVLQYEARAGT